MPGARASSGSGAPVELDEYFPQVCKRRGEKGLADGVDAPRGDSLNLEIDDSRNDSTGASLHVPMELAGE